MDLVALHISSIVLLLHRALSFRSLAGWLAGSIVFTRMTYMTFENKISCMSQPGLFCSNAHVFDFNKLRLNKFDALIAIERNSKVKIVEMVHFSSFFVEIKVLFCYCWHIFVCKCLAFNAISNIESIICCIAFARRTRIPTNDDRC